MKKRVLALLMIGCMACTMIACGDKETDEKADAAVESETEETADDAQAETNGAATDGTPITNSTVDELGIDAFVKGVEYKGLEVEKVIYEVTEADIETEIASALSYSPMQITDRAVEMGDTINLDYSGSIDGEVFEGGTAAAQSLEIGSGSFIDDFEEQLVGIMPGESCEVEVTFPEEYHSAELAGKDAVFACTVNYIENYLTEVTDEWLASNTTYATLEEYKESIRENLEATNAANAETQALNNALTTVIEGADVVMYPQDMIDGIYTEMKATYEYYASMYGVELTEYMEMMGMTDDDIVVAAESNTRAYLAFIYICEQEGVTEDSQEYQDKLAGMLSNYGLTTMDEAVANGISEMNIDYAVRFEYVNGIVLDNAVITEVAEEATVEE